MPALKDEDITVILAAYRVARAKREIALAELERCVRQTRDAEKRLADEENRYTSARILVGALNDEEDLEIKVSQHKTGMHGPGWEVRFSKDNCWYSAFVSQKSLDDFKAKPEYQEKTEAPSKAEKVA